MIRNFEHIVMDGAEVHDHLDTGAPVRLERGGLYMCRRGECEIVIDMKQFHIAAGDMMLTFPFSVIQVIRHSDDFDGYVIGTEENYFSSFRIPDKSSYYLHIKDNPCVTPSQKEWSRIVHLHTTMLEESAEQDHPLRSEIDGCNMKKLAYEIAAVYIRHKPITQQHRSRQERIFQQFIFSLFNNFHQHRLLEHYASEQSITPRHLSIVVKQVSGQTAGEWVANCLIENIKSKLQDPNLSIGQIADQFNFPNHSAFTQYFKRCTGQLPREYRAAQKI